MDEDRLHAALHHLEELDDPMSPNLILEIEFMERNNIDSRMLFPFVRERLNDEWSPLRGGDYENVIVANKEPLADREVADILTKVIGLRRQFLGLKDEISTDWNTENFELPPVDPFLNADRSMRSTSMEEEESIGMYMKDRFPAVAQYGSKVVRFAHQQGYKRLSSGQDRTIFKTPLFQVYAWIARNNLMIDARFIDLISVAKIIARG